MHPIFFKSLIMLYDFILALYSNKNFRNQGQYLSSVKRRSNYQGCIVLDAGYLRRLTNYNVVLYMSGQQRQHLIKQVSFTAVFAF